MNSYKQIRLLAAVTLLKFGLLGGVPALGQIEIIDHQSSATSRADTSVALWGANWGTRCEDPLVFVIDPWNASATAGPIECGPFDPPAPGLSAVASGSANGEVLSATGNTITIAAYATGFGTTNQPDPGYQLAYAEVECSSASSVTFRLTAPAYVSAVFQLSTTIVADPGGWNPPGAVSAHLGAPWFSEDAGANEDVSRSEGPRFLVPGTYLVQVNVTAHPYRNGNLFGATGTNTANAVAEVALTFTEVIGACCLPSGECQSLTAEQCGLVDGSYYGDESSCTGRSCQGACCLNRVSGDCELLSNQQCDLQSGRFWGNGTTCAEYAQYCVGACCLPGGGCELMTDPQCAEINGRYSGDGSTCNDVDCPPVLQVETTPLRTCKLTNARFHVTASCGTQSGDWTYRWWRYQPETDWLPLEDDGHILGSSTDTLRILGLRAGDVSPTSYVVEVMGPCGGIFGDSIMLEFKSEDLTNPDDNADGDGIPDCWETEGAGMDVNDDGIRDLDLYANGARPNHKDLFVEIDGMQFIDINSFRPAFAEVVSSFEQAPVDNPDNTTGIHLFLEFDPFDIDYEEFTQVDCSGYPVNGSNWKTQHFGKPAQQSDPNWDNIRVAKQKCYRWCLLLSRPLEVCCGFPVCQNKHAGLLGVAELPGDDFAVFADQMTRRPLVVAANQHALIPYLVAETFMHELGHTLNLRHGGFDNINGKPNYRSVMNYTACLTLDRLAEENVQSLDYSRRRLNALFESDLSESVGIAGGVEYDLWSMPFGFTIEGRRQYRFVRLDGLSVDFGALDDSLEPDGQITSHARQDLNYFGNNFANGSESPSPNDELVSFDDWSNLQYAIVPASNLAAFSEPPAEDEPTFEQTQWRLSWPAIRSDCQDADWPRILTEPTDVTLVSGAALELVVEATGDVPLNYQWVKDGAAIVDANNALYRIDTSRLVNAGSYKVWVNNGCGGTESTTITVTVLPPPGDLDVDGDVDLQDLAALLTAFGNCSDGVGFNPSADVVADGCIDLLDLTQLLSQFGQW